MSDDLVMNPFVDIHLHPAPEAFPIDVSRIEVISVKCPVRGQGLVIRDLTSTTPELFAFFLTLVARDGELDLASDSPLVADLIALGFLLPEADIVDWPAFVVPLEDAARAPRTSAIPAPREAAIAAEAAPAERWLVSPSFLFQPAFALHPGVPWPPDYTEQEGRLRCFAPGPAFWLGEPSSFVAPFWVAPDDASLLAALAPGAPPPPLPTSLAASLARVGALVPADPPATHATAAARFARYRAAYEASGYVVAQDLIPSHELLALRRYYAALLAANLVPLGDRQNRARYSTYNDPIGRFFHARLTHAMSAVAGQPVEPSFSYFFSYLEGAILEPHKDRPQAEFSISLQVDHTPPPAAATHWPLCFTFDDGRTATADLALGDAVLYHGRTVTHFRGPLPPGQRSSLLVLEYVPLDFTGLRI